MLPPHCLIREDVLEQGMGTLGPKLTNWQKCSQTFTECRHEPGPVLGAWGVSVNAPDTGPASRELPFYWGNRQQHKNK